MQTLTIIGCGKVGKTLGALWAQQDVFQIQQLFNRTPAHAQEAARFVGQGTPVWEWSELKPADLFLLSTPDRSIREARQHLAHQGLLRPGTILFHCSGALASSVLQEGEEAIQVASVHPVKSFANSDNALATFAGTYCGIEGDPQALAVLEAAFTQIGGICFAIHPQHKTLYHAASVLVCNYLTALMEVGLQTYEEAGIPRATALPIMEPIVRETVDNVFRLGTVQALTGPIARGDGDVVIRQRDALEDWNPAIGRLYTLLGQVAVGLAKQQGIVSHEVLLSVEQALSEERDRQSPQKEK